jgi:cytochrome c peroxidase
MTRLTTKLALLSLVGSTSFFHGAESRAATPDEILAQYEAQAKKADKAFTGFSVENGKKFFAAENTNKKGEKVSCTTCHTQDPKATGKTRAGKPIEPMAPSVNKERFTDMAKVEKWFKRNCKDVYDRECTLLEKGDFVAYMKSL